MERSFFVYNSINILHQNIDGLINKSDLLNVHLELLSDEHSTIDVLCITEHNMLQSDKDLLNIPNFTLAAYCGRKSRHGGCCIMTRNIHKYKSIDIEKNSATEIFECCAVEIIDHKLIIVCVYRAPKTTIDLYELFFKKMSDILCKLCFNRTKIVLCGDFNINILIKDKITMRFLQMLDAFNLKPSINEPTRLRSGTCIDNICQNVRGCKASVLDYKLSDHTAQLLSVPVKKTYSITYWYITKRDYSKENIKKFTECLGSLSFSESYELKDANLAFSTFIEIFKLFYDLCFPILRIRIHANRKPKWITKGIKLCCKRKRELLWSYRRNPTTINESRFKVCNMRLKKVLKLTRKAKNDFTIKNASNKSKATWGIINEHKSSRPKEYITQIKQGNTIITDPVQIANAFNNFYADQAKLVGSTPATKDFSSSLKSVFMKPVTAYEIETIIRTLKNTNSTGYDEISTKIVKEVAHIISGILSHVINLCLENGVFPDQLKLTIIKPLFKKDDRENVTCYRPIALIPIFSKIFEKVIYNNIYPFLEYNNILAKEQIGFRKGKSTNLAIYHLLKTIMTKIEDKVPVCALFMDLSKAFDHVDHAILLKKLSSCGIRGNALNLIKSYLSDRIQATEISRLCCNTKTEKNYRSNHRTVSVGVPQGSILGPLLFLIYINDFPSAIKRNMILYADDSTLILTNRNEIGLENDANETLANIVIWLKAHNLVLNIDKTNYMRFCNRKQPTSINISFEGRSIREICVHKFLGIHLDSHLNWKAHVETVCTRLSQFSYALYQLSKVANRTTVLIAYRAHVESILRYGLIFWGNSTNRNDALVAQKRCVRSVCRLKPTDSCKPHFKMLHILTLPSLYILEVSIFVKSNLDLFNKFISKRNLYNINTFSRKTALFGQSIFGMCTRIYNNLPLHIRQLTSITMFKRKLYNFLNDKCYYDINDYLHEKL